MRGERPFRKAFVFDKIKTRLKAKSALGGGGAKSNGKSGAWYQLTPVRVPKFSEEARAPRRRGG
jgi:hypothetical protein